MVLGEGGGRCSIIARTLQQIVREGARGRRVDNRQRLEARNGNSDPGRGTWVET